MELKDICHRITDIAAETSRYIINESFVFDIKEVETKGLHDFVSYVDKGAERMIIDKLASLVPEAGFIAEEGTSLKEGKRFNWIIDPLDGTTNFIHRLHPHAISIALKEGNEVIAGVVYEVSGNEIFTAWKNGGAWLNQNRIEVATTANLHDSLIATGFPYRDFSRLEPYTDCLKYFIKNSGGVRRMGCASIDLAYVACGRFEAFFEYNLKQWDVAAGILLVREAGGVVSDFSGVETNITGKEIIAANRVLYPQVQKVLGSMMI